VITILNEIKNKNDPNTVSATAWKKALRIAFQIIANLLKQILNYNLYCFSSDIRLASKNGRVTNSYSVVLDDSKFVYVGVAIACAVIVILAVTIAVLHVQSIPKSDKNKQRYLALILRHFISKCLYLLNVNVPLVFFVQGLYQTPIVQQVILPGVPKKSTPV
jgi:ABC-type phosphate/phosphonate transport system permease subunit